MRGKKFDPEQIIDRVNAIAKKIAEVFSADNPAALYAAIGLLEEVDGINLDALRALIPRENILTGNVADYYKKRLELGTDEGAANDETVDEYYRKALKEYDGDGDVDEGGKAIIF